MSLVSFRPHTLRILRFTEGYYDNNGDYHAGVEVSSDAIACRYEPNGMAKVVPVGEGRNTVYNYMVYLDTSCPEIPFGTRLELYNQEDASLGVFSSLGFHRGQLNAKLWV